MSASTTPVAFAVLGLFALVALGALLLPSADFRVETHQVPPVQAPTTPSVGGTPTPPSVPSMSPNAISAPPLLIDGNPAAGQATHVQVVSPLDPRVVLVDLNENVGGTTMNILGTQVLQAQGAASPFVITGDALRGSNVTFTINLPGAIHWLKVDRSKNPAVISTDIQSESVSAPLSWQGDLTNPTDVAIYNVAPPGPTLLARYHDNGDGTSTLTYLNVAAGGNGYATQGPLQHSLFLLDGSPLGPSWSVTAMDPVNHVPLVKVSVPLAPVRAAMVANGVVPDSYLTIAGNALPDVQAYKAVTDGARTLGPSDLDGSQFVSGAVPLQAYVDLKDTDVGAALGAPILMLDQQLPPTATTKNGAMQRGDSANGYTRFTAPLPADWVKALPEGSVVDFAIAYDVTVAKGVTQQLMDDNNGQGYRFKVDHDPPRAPALQVSVPDSSKPALLHVAWSSDDLSSGVATFRVEKGHLDEVGNLRWEDWIAATPQSGADFTGKSGGTYQFRARATDNVGIEGPVGQSDRVTVPGGSGAGGDTNRAPSVQLLAPSGGETFRGVPDIAIAWKASDPDGTVPVINLFVSDDGGATWNPIASPTGTQYHWDITHVKPGDYRLKVEATDGSLSNQDTSGKFHVDTAGLASADSIGGPGAGNQQGLPGGTAGSTAHPANGAQGAGLATPGDGGIMLAGFAVVLIGAGIALVVWRLRNR